MIGVNHFTHIISQFYLNVCCDKLPHHERFGISSSNTTAKLICQEYNALIKRRHFMEQRTQLKKCTHSSTRSRALRSCRLSPLFSEHHHVLNFQRLLLIKIANRSATCVHRCQAVVYLYHTSVCLSSPLLSWTQMVLFRVNELTEL